MPITKSAKKRVRQEKTRKARNKIVSLKFKANIKELLEHIAKKNKTKSQELFKICEKQLTIAGNRGILKKKKISRKISSLNSKIKAIWCYFICVVFLQHQYLYFYILKLDLGRFIQFKYTYLKLNNTIKRVGGYFFIIFNVYMNYMHV